MGNISELQQRDGLRRRKSGAQTNPSETDVGSRPSPVVWRAPPAAGAAPNSAPVGGYRFRWHGSPEDLQRAVSVDTGTNRSIAASAVYGLTIADMLDPIPEAAPVDARHRADPSPRTSIASLASTESAGSALEESSSLIRRRPSPHSNANDSAPRGSAPPSVNSGQRSRRPSETVGDPPATAERSCPQQTWEALFQPVAILASELATNLTGLTGTLGGRFGYDRLANRANRAVGPFGVVNGVQLFHANWVDTTIRPSEVATIASIASFLNGAIATLTAWRLTEAHERDVADFHSLIGTVLVMASELADLRDTVVGLRDAWGGQTQSLPRTLALMTRVLAICASAVLTMLAILEDGNAPGYQLAAAVLPIVGTAAGGAAEALNRESVRNRLHARLHEIASWIGGGGPPGPLGTPAPSGTPGPSDTLDPSGRPGPSGTRDPFPV